MWNFDFTYSWQRGVLTASNTREVNYWIAWWLEICAYGSVNLFAIISGWLGIAKKKYSSFRLLELMSSVIFYSIFITLIFLYIRPDIFLSVKNIIKGFVPAISENYWYITMYIPLFVIQPYINKMIMALSEKQHKVLCGLLILFFSVLPTMLLRDFFITKKGYSFLWLLICYIIGAYLRRIYTVNYKLFTQMPIKLFVRFTGASLVLVIGNLFLDRIFGGEWHYFIEYTSPIILVMSVWIFLIVLKKKIIYGKRIILFFSTAAFDIYLIHCHIFIFDEILTGAFQWIINLYPLFIPVVTVVIAISIYFVLTFIAKAKNILFEKMGVLKICRKIAYSIDRNIYIE